VAVLVEATSVIVRRGKLEAAYSGGWSGFVADCPNKTLCADRHIARIGFMSPLDVEGLFATWRSLAWSSSETARQ
jgi:hypothetical protein